MSAVPKVDSLLSCQGAAKQFHAEAPGGSGCSVHAWEVKRPSHSCPKLPFPPTGMCWGAPARSCCLSSACHISQQHEVMEWSTGKGKKKNHPANPDVFPKHNLMGFPRDCLTSSALWADLW